MRTITLAVALVLVLIVAVALGVIGLRGFEQDAVGSGEGQTSHAAEASATLQELEVASPGSMSGYSREKFRH
jgi:hypothetical protein